MKIEKHCLFCHKLFVADRPEQNFCCRSCGARNRSGYVFNEDAGAYDIQNDGTCCKYNVGVICYAKKCSNCGWNPEVAKARLDKIMGVT